ncbi:unnamed protein product [Euphydryas editha]|uniref:Guanylate kinase-like domain-containing protein n=1 Tax=Euphydryas editha TaxID=104508 RepID=A0AAU9TQZ4_EUPED|nr:unnamed protein product [Euphydryas editha]
MSDSDISLDDPANPVLLDTPDSDDSLELDIIERGRRRNETLQNLEEDEEERRIIIKSRKRKKDNNKRKDQSHQCQATLAEDIEAQSKFRQDKVISYAKMSLVDQHLSHIRPIVLIGPPNIGRHELRQRLMEDSSRFAVAVPHTSRTCMKYEAQGLDYYFISREQFESDTRYMKFVEYGEFENDYYGTSIEAVKAVVNSGKICVLKVRCETLDILRISELKPNRVFVALLELGEAETED